MSPVNILADRNCQMSTCPSSLHEGAQSRSLISTHLSLLPQHCLSVLTLYLFCATLTYFSATPDFLTKLSLDPEIHSASLSDHLFIYPSTLSSSRFYLFISFSKYFHLLNTWPPGLHSLQSFS